MIHAMRLGLYLGTGVALLGIAWLIVHGSTTTPGEGAPSSSPPPSAGRGQLLGNAAITVFPKLTYFATLETNGSVDAAANVDRVKARAEAEGFRDVVVSKGKRIANWPGTINGDYFVRGTFAGATPKNFARHVDVFLGSLNVLDAWEA